MSGALEGQSSGALEGQLSGALEGRLSGALEGQSSGALEGQSSGALEGRLSGALEVEIFGLEHAPLAPRRQEIERLCVIAAATLGIADGHVAIELVDEKRIAQLNLRHRGKAGPTDVLSFPIDEREEQHGVERELGDVVICPAHTVDLREAIVHGVLHLLGMDHETDEGQMLSTQAQILDGAGRQA